MQRRTKVVVIAAGAAAALAVAGTTAAIATTGDDAEAPITGSALERATQAALEHTGGGEVTDTEVGDEESRYEVEVTLPDGRQVDVQLDAGFAVVGEESDGAGEDED